MSLASHSGIGCREVERTYLGFCGRCGREGEVRVEAGPLLHRLHFLFQEWTTRLCWLSSHCWMAKEPSLIPPDKVSAHRPPFSLWVSTEGSGSHAEHVRFVGYGGNRLCDPRLRLCSGVLLLNLPMLLSAHCLENACGGHHHWECPGALRLHDLCPGSHVLASLWKENTQIFSSLWVKLVTPREGKGLL